MSIPPVRGDRLSCYTAAIATYLARQGIDWELLLGTQLYLAVSDGTPPSLVHYHRPLDRAAGASAPALVRCWSDDPAVASARVQAECARAGAVIAVGDTFNLPWSAAFGARHAPHWFVIDGCDAASGMFHVDDRFAYRDEGGQQDPFAGTLPLAQLPALLAAHPEPSPIHRAQERWAFGVEEPAAIAVHGHQWYERTGQPLPEVVQACGAPVRSDLPPGWSQGREALARIASYAEAHLATPALYESQNDLWVVARTRQLFGETLLRLAAGPRGSALGPAGRWFGETLVPQWMMLPRLMRFNAGSLARGRPPRPLLLEALRKTIALEEEATVRLAEAAR